MGTGIVLGGGGTLGDFQVGVLKYLHEKEILRDIICVCGTSIGAINAAIVATGECNASRLEKYWVTDVKTRGDLIPQHDWDENIAPVFDAVIDGSAGSWVSATAKLICKSRGDTISDLFSAKSDLEEMFTKVRKTRALYSAELLEKKMRDSGQDLDLALKSNIALRMYAINLATGTQTCFCNAAGDADYNTMKSGNKSSASRSLSAFFRWVCGRLCHKMATEPTSLNDNKVIKLCDSKEKLIKGALASAALPAIFPPVEVDDDWYTDGSVREVVPVQGAIDCGADMIYAILCFPRLINRGEYGIDERATEDWSTSSLFDIRTEDFNTIEKDWSNRDDRDLIHIINRALAIVLDEITSGDLEVARRHDPPVALTVIDPLIPVHGLAELNVGLLKINMDQGYMRAFDEIDASDKSRNLCIQLTREITAKRVAIWKDEHALIKQWAEAEDTTFDFFSPLREPHVRRVLSNCVNAGRVDTRILVRIRKQKRDLKRYVAKRLEIAESPRALPADYEAMYLEWELHDTSLEMSDITLPKTPWDRLDLGRKGKKVIPAEAHP
jgi:NTE family protein